jgi:hypothetical protein
MNLIRCQKQGDQSLEQYFFEYFRKSDPSGLLYAKMEELLNALRDLDFEKPVFCLTSHHKLRFLTRNDPSSTWWSGVSVNPLAIQVEYRVPEALAPWKGAYTCGEFENVQEAAEKLLLGMRLSGGWRFKIESIPDEATP